MLRPTSRPARALAALVSCLALGSTALGVVTAAPASAASTRVEDPIDQGPAAYDLTSVDVTNGPYAVRVRLGVRELKPGVASVLAVLGPARGEGPTFVVGTALRRDGRVVGLFRPTEDGAQRVRCRGVRVVLDRADEEVRARVPRRCLDGLPDRISVLGLTEQRGGGDRDETRVVRLRRG